MSIAQYFKNTANEQHKIKEIQLTKDLLQQTNSPSVLGVTHSIEATLQTWESEPEQLQKKLTYWQQILKIHPDFRDAYVQAGYIASILGDTKTATIYWKKATDIDPLILTP